MQEAWPYTALAGYVQIAKPVWVESKRFSIDDFRSLQCVASPYNAGSDWLDDILVASPRAACSALP